MSDTKQIEVKEGQVYKENVPGCFTAILKVFDNEDGITQVRIYDRLMAGGFMGEDSRRLTVTIQDIKDRIKKGELELDEDKHAGEWRVY